MSRIEKLRLYMFEVIEDIVKNNNFDINIDFLDIDINNYSLNKIPTESTIEKWIDGTEINQDTYNFTSKRSYSADVNNNLNNIGFYEMFEDKIETNNKKRILPNIQGIQSIECLNCGALSSANIQDCIFSIQIRIMYIKEG